jgi:hypothetical protein
MKYPGKIRDYGLGLGYQRFVWKNLHSTVYTTPFLTQFYDSNYNKIQKGFRVNLREVIGYRFEFLKHRWYLDPSVEFNYRPVNTNMPESFKTVEKKSSNYSLFGPNLYFGYRF